MGSKKIAAKLCVRPGHAESVCECGSSTSAAKVCFEDRHSMAFAQSAITTSVVLLESADNTRVVQIVVECDGPAMHWHTEQRRALRSSDGTEQWLVEQTQGKLLEHVSERVQRTGDLGKLAKCGLATSRRSAAGTHREERVGEDELADILGQHCLILASCRLRRALDLSMRVSLCACSASRRQTRRGRVARWHSSSRTWASSKP